MNYANELQNVLGMEFTIATTDIWIGLEVEFTQQCYLMYQSMNITSHVTLTVAKGDRAKEIGPIIM